MYLSHSQLYLLYMSLPKMFYLHTDYIFTLLLVSDTFQTDSDLISL